MAYMESSSPCCNTAIAASLYPAGALSIKLGAPISGAVLEFWINMARPAMPDSGTSGDPDAPPPEASVHLRLDASAATDGASITLPLSAFQPVLTRLPSEWVYVAVDTREFGAGFSFDRVSWVNALGVEKSTGGTDSANNILFVDGVNIVFPNTQIPSP